MKILFLLFISLISYANVASATETWDCSAKAGFMGADTIRVRLEKQSNGYAAFITASSGDVGSQWQIKDEKVIDGLNCKFSKVSAALYCISQGGSGWTTVTAEDEMFQSVDQYTGEDKTTKLTEIIVSGTGEILKKFPNSVLRFGATDCSIK